MLFSRIKKRKYRMMYIILIIMVAIAATITGFMNLPKFGRSPRGERLERIKMSPNYRNGMFRNQQETKMLTSDQSRARVMLNFLFEKKERNRPDAALPVIKTDLKALNRDTNLFVWFGHSSYLIQCYGKRLLIDPVFDEASPVSFFNKPFKGTDIYKADDMPDIDYLIITHDHWDHLDYKTVTQLKDRIGKVICPLGVGEHFERWDFKKEQVVELDWYEQFSPDSNFTVHCLPSRHFSGRTFRSNQTLWASFIVKTPVQTVYIGGDGGYDKRFAETAQRFPDIDLAIMENGQYNKDWHDIHLMPEDLPKAIHDLLPKKILTVHNSKYALAKHAWDEPLNNIAATAEKESLPLIMPQIGEVVYLNDTIKPVNRWWDRTAPEE